MGAVAPVLGITRIRQPGCSSFDNKLSEERFILDSRMQIRMVKTSRFAIHSLHVYRHVDIEELQSKAPQGATPLNLRGARPHDCFPADSVHHAKHTRIAEQTFGVAL